LCCLFLEIIAFFVASSLRFLFLFYLLSVLLSVGLLILAEDCFFVLFFVCVYCFFGGLIFAFIVF
jgi:hypothetical protein